MGGRSGRVGACVVVLATARLGAMCGLLFAGEPTTPRSVVLSPSVAPPLLQHTQKKNQCGAEAGIPASASEGKEGGRRRKKLLDVVSLFNEQSGTVCTEELQAVVRDCSEETELGGLRAAATPKMDEDTNLLGSIVVCVFQHSTVPRTGRGQRGCLSHSAEIMLSAILLSCLKHVVPQEATRGNESSNSSPRMGPSGVFTLPSCATSEDSFRGQQHVHTSPVFPFEVW
ncbi:uncharacterized protein LOC133556304 [Nerophis ophidion]|uniref:uncharacterized protein LOC133556304 n=1 Tax=Nerophis ophidion TaxID=159077 RepID=UPI002ADF2D17|nr:uncharacterized protein LOC133556304 [Nerophis ophidion]